jgi:hypothetical protein
MDLTRQQSIIDEFSDLFSDSTYFDVGDGWYDLIRSLCKEIKKLPRRRTCKIQEVKSKFAELRVYAGPSSKEMLALIDKYSIESRKICETCGSPGRVNTQNGWMTVLCDVCFVHAS